MKKWLALIGIAAVVAIACNAAPAAAQVIRTFVSGLGSDANPCTRTSPCRTFAQAATLTSAGGEITVLDPAGYGSLTITQSLSIVNDGVGEAGVTVTTAGADAITINATSAVINLRGLTLVGTGAGNNGIFFNVNASKITLTMQNCVIRGFTYGLSIGGSGTRAHISDTVVSSNSVSGVVVYPSGSALSEATFTRVQFLANTVTGLNISDELNTGPLNVTVVDSISSANDFGFGSGTKAGGGTATMTLIRSEASQNQTGLSVSGQGATMILAQSSVDGNTTDGYSVQSSGILYSYGNNFISDAAHIGSLTPLSVQ